MITWVCKNCRKIYNDQKPDKCVCNNKDFRLQTKECYWCSKTLSREICRKLDRTGLSICDDCNEILDKEIRRCGLGDSQP